jgi:Holliday junction resolvase-like predicted endonuclease
MLTAAQMYLAQNELDSTDWRIDVIAVALPRSSAPLIEHLENGLDW